LEDLGLSFVWITQGTLDKSQQTWFKNTVNRQIKDRFITVWRAGTEASPNCINYRLFKSMFECELYIKKLPTFLAISLMKFRCRNTKLPVVKLRYDNLVYSPECTLCDSGEIGDEFHVLLKCPFLKEERRKLLGKESFPYANTIVFSEIMNTNNERKLRNLARFVRTINLICK
jgi:hypothetical protein